MLECLYEFKIRNLFQTKTAVKSNRFVIFRSRMLLFKKLKNITTTLLHWNTLNCQSGSRLYLFDSRLYNNWWIFLIFIKIYLLHDTCIRKLEPHCFEFTSSTHFLWKIMQYPQVTMNYSKLRFSIHFSGNFTSKKLIMNLSRRIFK